MAGKRPVGTLGGSAGYDNGKQCNRKAQHRLLRNSGSDIAPVYRSPWGVAVTILKYG